MILRTVSRDWIVCPSCGERHGELCSCGVEMLCWFEREVTY